MLKTTVVISAQDKENENKPLVESFTRWSFTSERDWLDFLKLMENGPVEIAILSNDIPCVKIVQAG